MRHLVGQDLHPNGLLFAVFEALASLVLRILRELLTLHDALAADAQTLVHLID